MKIAVDVLLALGVGVALLSSIGIVAMRDPYQRLVAELWARHAPPAQPEPPPRPAAAPTRDGLRRALGWRP